MAEEEKKEEEGGNKTLLILGIIIGIAVGGGAVYTFLGQQAPTAEVEEEVEEEKPKRIEYPNMEFKKVAVPVYTIRRGKPYEAGNYILDFNIQVEPDHFDHVVKYRVEFQQAFLSALNKNDVMQDGSMSIIDYNKASSVLTAAAKRVVNASYVHNVIIINAVKVP